MALFQVDLRGTVLSETWAIHMWVMTGGATTAVAPAGTASDLAASIALAWTNKMRPITPTSVTLEKVVVKAKYGSSEEYEFGVGLTGAAPGAIPPTFNALGFRQYKSEAGFRAATHRVPMPLKENMSGNTWVSGNTLDLPQMVAAAAFFSDPVTTPSDVEIGVPVLISTQTTVKNPDGSKVTTPHNPWFTTPVTSAAFYGLTSQDSRKDINGVS